MGTGVEAAVIPEVLGETALADTLPFVGEGLGVSEAGANAAQALSAAGGAEAGAGLGAGLAEGVTPAVEAAAPAATTAPAAAPPAAPVAQLAPTSPVTGAASAAAPEAPIGEVPGLPPSAQEGAGYITPETPAPPPEPAPVAQQPVYPDIPTTEAAPIREAGVPASSADTLRLAQASPAGQAAQTAQQANSVRTALEKLGVIDKEGGIGRNALPLAGLALNAIAQRRAGNTLERSLQQAGQRTGGAADALLQQGLSGQAPAAVMAQADQTYRDTVEKIKQQYANMGRDPRTDTGAIAAMNRAAIARDAQIQQYAQGLTSQGLQAAQIAQTPATQAALAAAQQDRELAAAQANVLRQLSQVQAAQGA